MRTKVMAAAGALLLGAGGAVAAAQQLTHEDCVLNGSSRTCFSNYREAIAYASGGGITDAPLSARQAASDAGFQRRVAAYDASRGSAPGGARGGLTTSVQAEPIDPAHPGWVIGVTLFTESNYGGDSTTITIPKPCEKNGIYDYYYDLIGFKQRVKSLQPWANCWAWLHDGDSFDANREGPYKTGTPDLGGWNNRATQLGLS